jgi:AbiTii
MSALLDDIINLSEDDKQSLPNLLRKCLRLASDLKIECLKSWADQELNGYKDGTGVPAYRVITANAYGNFAGPFRSWYPNHLIVPVVLDEKHRHFAETAEVFQSVGSLDDLAKGDNKGTLILSWPPVLVALYQSKLLQGAFCHDAWQEVPKSALIEILDAVRNATLRMALEIKEELGTTYNNLDEVKSRDVAKAISMPSANDFEGDISQLTMRAHEFYYRLERLA